VMAIVSFVLALLGYVLNAAQAHTNAWFSPFGLGLLSLAALALHLAGWPRR
jgi:hypothetical protein